MASPISLVHDGKEPREFTQMPTPLTGHHRIMTVRPLSSKSSQSPRTRCFELKLPGVDGVLDLLSVGNLLGGVADEQCRAADQDGRSGHPQQAVGVAMVKCM
jgi:hypothetical protein